MINEKELSEAAEACSLELNDTLKDMVLCAENTKDNIFLTGNAGTGKSAALKLFTTITTKRVAVIAPTGIAAVNVNGQTIHSFFGFPHQPLLQTIVSNSKVDQLVSNTDVIVIDEISMVRQDIFFAIDIILKKSTGRTNELFGGKQIICIGDVFQLPPVITDKEKKLYMERFDSVWFFKAKAFRNFKLFNLTKIYRQGVDEEKFKVILNKIRIGTHTQSDLNELNKNVKPLDLQRGMVHLVTTNSKAEVINDERLSVIEAKLHTYEARISGTFPESMYPTLVNLQLKVGAQVMNLRNASDIGIYNGQIGKVVDFTTMETEFGSEDVVVVNFNGREVNVRRVSWENIEYNAKGNDLDKTILGRFKQFPLKLAYAITIHKSQGQTFDRVKIDFGNGTFAPGQAYVALSRCKTLTGLFLQRAISMRDIYVDKEVQEFYKEYFSTNITERENK